MATRTPWGDADAKDVVTRGIIFYSTPSHGGFHVAAKLNATMPDHLRRRDGWYEEDCDWCLVVTAFPQHFSATQREQAEHTLKNWHPEAWAIQYGRTLDPSESYILRSRLERAHA